MFMVGGNVAAGICGGIEFLTFGELRCAGLLSNVRGDLFRHARPDMRRHGAIMFSARVSVTFLSANQISNVYRVWREWLWAATDH